MRVLLINPSFPDSYWSGRRALSFAKRKSLLPPLGLITVAALIPQDWKMRLVDMDVEPLNDRDILWADVVMLTGMLVQRKSLHEVLDRCRRHGVRTVVGGPYASSLPDEFVDKADHVVIGEGENIVPKLAQDLMDGDAQPVYHEGEEKPDPATSPTPRFDLLKKGAYHQMSIQWSRGCPFKCEFCDIIVLFGRQVRTKTFKQLEAELNAIRSVGFRGTIFIVDDNFIGNKSKVRELLPQIEMWRERNGRPFDFYTEASMNLADDLPMVQSMVQAGFGSVFIGIETPSEAALRETSKIQNTRRNLEEQVHLLLENGLDVWAGFILGFDSDEADIFDRMIDFISVAAIPYAMVGMLAALPGTPLYERMEREGRLHGSHDGDQFAMTNFYTKLPAEVMADGYSHVIDALYSPRGFFDRCRTNLQLWNPINRSRSINWHDIKSGLRAIWGQGIKAHYRREYWRFLGWVIMNYPAKLPRALAQAASGHHYICYTSEIVLPRLQKQAAGLAHSVGTGS